MVTSSILSSSRRDVFILGDDFLITGLFFSITVFPMRRRVLYYVKPITAISQQTRNVGPMLGHRLRRWPNIEPTFGECVVFGVLITGCQGSA